MGAGGQKWVRMGAVGCMHVGGTKKKTKNDTNTRAGHDSQFQSMVTAKKNRKSTGMVTMTRENHGEAMAGKQGVCGDIVCIY